MKKMLPVLFLLFLITLSQSEAAFGQCTGTCNYTYNGSGGTSFNLAAGEQLCITGTASGLNINYNGANTKVCVASGASWNADFQNFSNAPVIEVWGTMTLNNANFNSNITINVMSGGVLNYGRSDFSGNGKFTLNNSGTVNFTTTGTLTVQGNGGQEKTINNLAGGVINATAPSLVLFNQQNAVLVNSGTINFKNLENSESNITNNAGGTMVIQGSLNNHGEFKNYGTVSGTCQVSPCTFTVGDKGAGFGFKNYSTGVVSFSGNTTFQGYTLNDGLIQINNGNLTINSNPINNMAGTNGRIIVTNGTSSITNSGACFAGTGMKFCDVNTAGNGFDANANPGCVAGVNYTIDCSIILNIKLLGFDFVKSAADTKLRWMVETDEPQNKFELQVSTDGRSFSTFETVTDNRKGVLTYLSMPLTGTEGKHYYRLKIFRQDGSFNFSNVISLDNKADQIRLYPNPVQGNTIYLAVTGVQNTTLNIFTAEGQLVLSKKLSGFTNYAVELPANVKGNLVAELIHQGAFKRFKLQVVR